MEKKFRAWDKKNKRWYKTELEFYGFSIFGECTLICPPKVSDLQNLVITQYTGIKDKNGKEIYEGDVLRFADKFEWYKSEYGPKIYSADINERKELIKQLENEPYEERVIEMPDCYEWLLSSEIQIYWEVAGNTTVSGLK